MFSGCARARGSGLAARQLPAQGAGRAVVATSRAAPGGGAAHL